MTFPGVEQAGVFAVRNEFGVDQLWAAIVVNSAVDEKALATHCASHWSAPSFPLSFIPVQSLPRNEMGKLQRDRLAIVAGKTTS